jgi:ATP-dependent DNA helicase RecQ
VVNLIGACRLVYKEDKQTHSEPNQIALDLTHRDVQLGYFEFVQHRLHNLFSGATLQVVEDGLATAKGDLICRYAHRFRDVLKGHAEKGFRIAEARVNFVVYWKDEGKDRESKIILPQLLLKKQ